MDFHKTHSTEIRFVIGPENTIRIRVCALFSPKFVPAWVVKGFMPGDMRASHVSVLMSLFANSCLATLICRVGRLPLTTAGPVHDFFHMPCVGAWAPPYLFGPG